MSVPCLFLFLCAIYPFCIITLDNSQGFLLISEFNKTETALNYKKKSLLFCVIFSSNIFFMCLLKLSGHRPVFPDTFREDLLDEIMSSNSQFPVRKYFDKFLKKQTEGLGFENSDSVQG